MPRQESRQVVATRLEKMARLVNIPYRPAQTRDLIGRRTVMARYDYTSVRAVARAATRLGIDHVVLGRRALYDPRDWEEAKAPSDAFIRHTRSVRG